MMSWIRFLLGIRKRGNPATGEVFEHLRSIAEFREILARERARADRSGAPFSLVTFTPRDPQTGRDTLAHLASYLRHRLRCTDDVGWIDDCRIGAVLPDTPASGAWKVADDACLSFSSEHLPPVCEVYVYPTDHAERLLESIDANREEASPERPSQSLELLFAQPLPRWKRGLDIVGASLGLVGLAPLLAVVGVLIKWTSPGPVLFIQKRSGLGGKPFMLYKFRSMRCDAEAKKAELMTLNEQDGPAFKIRNDPRVTPLGRLLRTTSIDELPQLWNVLRGDMSLVGPRPLPCHESEACTVWQKRRLDVTPGLTCIWQIKGRSSVTFNEWVRMDLQYLRSRSLFEDVKLLAQTIPAVLLRKGAS